MQQRGPTNLSLMEGYTRWARTYDTAWNTLIATEELYSLNLLSGLYGETALDVGTGTGRFALKLARNGWDVTAIDANPSMLAVARTAVADESLPIRFIQAAIEDGLPVESDAFDLVVCALTLCHIPGLRGAIAECHRSLAPDGHLLLTDVHPDFIAAGMPTQFVDDGVTYYLPNEPHPRNAYVKAVEDTGLNVHTVLDISTREIPGGFQTEFMRERFADVNFALIILARKGRD